MLCRRKHKPPFCNPPCKPMIPTDPSFLPLHAGQVGMTALVSPGIKPSSFVHPSLILRCYRQDTPTILPGYSLYKAYSTYKSDSPSSVLPPPCRLPNRSLVPRDDSFVERHIKHYQLITMQHIGCSCKHYCYSLQ